MFNGSEYGFPVIEAILAIKHGSSRLLRKPRHVVNARSHHTGQEYYRAPALIGLVLRTEPGMLYPKAPAGVTYKDNPETYTVDWLEVIEPTVVLTLLEFTLYVLNTCRDKFNLKTCKSGYLGVYPVEQRKGNSKFTEVPRVELKLYATGNFLRLSLYDYVQVIDPDYSYEKGLKQGVDIINEYKCKFGYLDCPQGTRRKLIKYKG